MKKYLLLGLLCLPFFVSAQAIPQFPMSFWGTVTVDGVAAPVGSVIRVYSAEVKVGEVTVQELGVYGYDEVTKQKLVVAGGDTLTFTFQSSQVANGVEISGVVPNTYNKFSSGVTVQKNLDFTTVKPSSGGGSSSGGGGGGGGSSKSKKTQLSPTSTPQVLGVSTSTLSIEEKRMELQKQIIALLLQLIEILKQQNK